MSDNLKSVLILVPGLAVTASVIFKIVKGSYYYEDEVGAWQWERKLMSRHIDPSGFWAVNLPFLGLGIVFTVAGILSFYYPREVFDFMDRLP